MKKLHLLLLSVALCLFSACHNDIWDAIDGLDSRVTKLEELCKEMNTNITSLQTIVDVLQSNDFITGIVEIKKNGEVIGYTITFGKHDPITIYHGQDGKDGQNGTNGKDGQDGQNGTDGKDGITPVIGVAQDTDGVYYWTLNGEWLLDDNGNKLPVSGKDGQNGTNGSNGQDGADGKDGQDGADGADGKDGQDGEDGKDGVDGQDGKDGKDGITPQLKIEDGYWYISYDNGATWTQLGKATGENGQDGKDGADGEDGKDGADGEDGKDGQNGADGKDGQDGDSMFQSVTQDENYVYFTLADGTVIKIAKGSGNNQSNDDFIFTITYDPNGGEGVMEKDTFYYGYTGDIDTCTFIQEGYYFSGEWNTNPNGSGVTYACGTTIAIDKNIILYAQWKKALGTPSEYIDLGLSVKWANCNVGAVTPEGYGDYFAWGETEPKDVYDFSTYKWCNGELNTLTKYCTDSRFGTVDYKTLLEMSDDAARANWGGSWRMPTDSEWKELCEQCTWNWTTQNGVYGYNVTSNKSGYTHKSIFLPATGYRSYNSYNSVGSSGSYWLSSLNSDETIEANSLSMEKNGVFWNSFYRNYGRCIRPVHP